MKLIMRLLFVAYILFCSFTAISQETVKVPDQVYGLDQTLCNGKKYTYVAPPGSKGDQFLLSTLFSVGSVTLRGKSYNNLSLNYDIVNQQLLMRYADDRSPWNVLEVSKAWLTDFRLGNKKFELLTLEQLPQFYQVIGEGPVRILYFWRKNLNLNDAIGASNFTFTPAIRDSFVLIDGKLKPFQSKRSFVLLFSAAHRQTIKTYLRKNKIKLKKASDEVMGDMITFIGHMN